MIRYARLFDAPVMNILKLFLVATLSFSATSIGLTQETSHGALIKQFDDDSLKRGQELYTRTCQICHGTVEKEGHFPNALRFSQGEFKNGSAPHQLHNSIRNGFGQAMPAHPVLSDTEIYDLVHYLREDFVKPHNKSQYFKVDEAYLTEAASMKLQVQQKRLPPWLMMNYGPTMSATYNLQTYSVTKGIAVRLDSGHGGITKGKRWMVFDQDTLQPAAGWEGEFSDYAVISLAGNRVPDDQHQLISNIRFSMPNEPAWANPATGDFTDQRFIGTDKRRYGPLPYEWGRFEGVHYQQDRPIIEYRIGERRVLEQYQSSDAGVFQRNLHLGAGDHPLKHRLAPVSVPIKYHATAGAKVTKDDKFYYLNAPAGEAVQFTMVLAPGPDSVLALDALDLKHLPIPDLAAKIKKPMLPRWKAVIQKPVKRHDDVAAYVVDDLILPQPNPWNCRVRFSGIDFFSDPDKAAVCTWDGDVWILKGVTGEEVSWRRVCTGLYQPLGLKIINEEIHVTCRDQLAKLVDSNEDGEIDFVKAFNSDHQVTTHWHEFTSGLAQDKEGYLYYVKAGRHGSPALVEHHGTVIQVDPDGKHSRVVATGFRATNGITNTPDGRLFMTDQEGTWNPENKIIEILPKAKKPDFFGFVLGYHKLGKKAEDDQYMSMPLVWVHRDVDRSPAGLVFADTQKWGPLSQKFLCLSYGHGQIHHVIGDSVKGKKQGAYVPINIQRNGRNHVDAGLLRGRFNQKDGQLYTCGLSDWASSRTTPAGIHRIRYTGKPDYTPVEIKNYQNGILVKFSSPLGGVIPTKSYLRYWKLVRTSMYGMRKMNHPKPKVPVKGYHLFDDQKTLFIECDMVKSWLTELQLCIKRADGTEHQFKLNNTAYELHDAFGLDRK